MRRRRVPGVRSCGGGCGGGSGEREGSRGQQHLWDVLARLLLRGVVRVSWVEGLDGVNEELWLPSL